MAYLVQIGTRMGCLHSCKIYDVYIYMLQDSIVSLTYQATGNAGDLGEHACELGFA